MVDQDVLGHGAIVYHRHSHVRVRLDAEREYGHADEEH